ncbi:SDR family NAD(P)-dependent oxidoreductase [Nitrospirillum amazonense]|uniref:SDR family NAD(P)-dependent oxidoreductase n=1 Tax=Nitrospirillum amazonense TaxID=28077 RepID=UPI002412B67F|nr:SDR family NAD(P)-dependent oxidoreductase [Nitrospirillum amazonense]MDG3439587.1 SDR family NAD(P)-dependent oxidoreductase [Nitrospirillum amazonense]
MLGRTMERALTGALAGKAALVTGGTRGLGLMLARTLADAGCAVAVIGRDPQAGASAFDHLQARGGPVCALSADVTDEQAMKAAAAEAEARLGPLDITVCAAGVSSPRAPIWTNSADTYRHCFDTNVLGVLNSLTATLPGMVARGGGKVIVIGGTYGHKGVAGFSVYAASKWALRGLVRSAALDAAPHGVTINMISPGGVDGERLRRLFRQSAAANGEPEDAPLKRFTAGTALGRLVGEDDVAAAMLHLLGPGGRMMTGQDIVVDAGMVV